MNYLDIWRFAYELRQSGTVQTKHATVVPHYDTWSTSEEAELARSLLFTNRTEIEFARSVTSGKETKEFVWRKDGFHVKTTLYSYGVNGPAPTYRPADAADEDLNFEEFKQSVVSEIREKVDKHVVSIISYRLLKQYKDRDAELDRLFGDQNY